ncbi:HAD-IA family hydrolase [Mesorhizobium australicum]|uniref:HAD family hydrolase n=1 Tax=Mesorhizobium australicum TaxID=536018 RepID=UPI00333D05D5
MRFDLVIFDCDGVLVDSEILAGRVDHALLREHGVDLGQSEVTARYAGLSYSDMIASVNREFRSDISAADFERNAMAKLACALEEELQPVAGIHQLLDVLPSLICVASSSPMTKLRRSLVLTDLLSRFDPYVFSTETVAQGKPAPDIIQHCCDIMGVPPDRTAVVEDSLHGIQAARSAGATAIAFLGGRHCTPQTAQTLTNAGAQLTAQTSQDLAQILVAKPE